MAINRLDGLGLPDGLGKSGGKTAATQASHASKTDGGHSAGSETAATREGDRIELSREARRIAELRKTVDDLPDIREDRVRERREALSRGTYRVESRELARAILKDPDAVAGE